MKLKKFGLYINLKVELQNFKTPSEISKAVTAGKTYDVNVANDKADDTGDITEDKLDKVDTACLLEKWFY